MDPLDAAEKLARPDSQPKIGLRATFRAFSHRNFRLFFMGQIISLIGTWMTTTAEGWLIYQLTSSKTLLGVVAAASTAPMILLSTVGGWMADRYPKRTILVITQSAYMLVALTLAFLVWHGSIAPWQLVLMASISGVIMAFDMPTRQAFIVEMTSKEDIVNAVSLNSAAFNSARIIGPSVAGVLMAKFGIAMCFFLDGISFIAVITGLLMMRLAPSPPRKQFESVWAGAKSGFLYVWDSPRLSRIFFLFFVVGIFGLSYSVLMPSIAKDVLNVGEKSYGMLLAANGIGALLGALTVAGLGHVVPPRKLAIGGSWLFSVAIFLFALTKVFWLALVMLAVAGYGMLLFFSSTTSAIQLLAKDGMRGRVMGVWAVAFGAIIPLGSLQAGALAQGIGSSYTIIVGAIISFLGATATLIHAKRAEARNGIKPKNGDGRG